MYSIELIDYSTPSFVSATQKYYGTKEDILKVLEINKEDRSDLLKAAEEFFSGQGEGIARVYYGAPGPFVKPVKLLGETTIRRDKFAWAHKNTWGCFYHMRADGMVCKVYYLETADRKIVRVLRPTFENLMCFGFVGDHNIAEEECWGHPGIITSNNLDEAHQFTSCNLMVSDKQFDTVEQAMIDKENPLRVNYTGFFNDVFGDG